MQKFSQHRTISVNEEYQSNYSYELSEKPGTNFRSDFHPDLSPPEMLALGIFGGDYFSQPPQEFPQEWFKGVQFSHINTSDKNLNYFGVNASQPLRVWEQNGWIYPEDPKGWFLWYCRYYLGRRIDTEDDRQIGRWKNMKRHITQLQNNCDVGDETCRPRQRQALLHWAYDSRKM